MYCSFEARINQEIDSPYFAVTDSVLEFFSFSYLLHKDPASWDTKTLAAGAHRPWQLEHKDPGSWNIKTLAAGTQRPWQLGQKTLAAGTQDPWQLEHRARGSLNTWTVAA